MRDYNEEEAVLANPRGSSILKTEMSKEGESDADLLRASGPAWMQHSLLGEAMSNQDRIIPEVFRRMEGTLPFGEESARMRRAEVAVEELVEADFSHARVSRFRSALAENIVAKIAHGNAPLSGRLSAASSPQVQETKAPVQESAPTR